MHSANFRRFFYTHDHLDTFSFCRVAQLEMWKEFCLVFASIFSTSFFSRFPFELILTLEIVEFAVMCVRQRERCYICEMTQGINMGMVLLISYLARLSCNNWSSPFLNEVAFSINE